MTNPTSLNLHPGKSRWGLSVLISLVVVLFALVARSPDQRLHDERYNLVHADAINAGRALKDIFTERTVSASGPVYPIIESFALRIGGANVRPARLLNLGVMCAIIALLAAIGRERQADPNWGFVVLAAPPFVVGSALANTEIWAAFFAFSSIGAILVLAKQVQRLPILLFSGVAMGLAILTRQSSAVLLLPLAYALWRSVRHGHEWVIVFGPPLLAILLLLSLWGGGLPPGQEGMQARGIFDVEHFWSGGSYIAAIGLLMMPRLALRPQVIVTMLAGAVLNLLTEAIDRPILASLLGSGPTLVGRALWGALAGAWLGFFGALVVDSLRTKGAERDFVQVLILCLLVIAFSCGIITGHFTSRYIVAAVPFLGLLTIALNGSRAYGGWQCTATVFGWGLGVFSLHFYGLW